MLPKKPHTSQVASYLSARPQFQPQWQNLCCNPFNKPDNFIRKKSELGVITKVMCEKVPAISHEEICDSFRKQLAAESEQQSLPQGHSQFPRV